MDDCDEIASLPDHAVARPTQQLGVDVSIQVGERH